MPPGATGMAINLSLAADGAYARLYSAQFRGALAETS